MASSTKAIVENLTLILKHVQARRGFDQLLQDVSVVSATPGKANFEMVVQPQHTNQGNTMHGGLTSTLIDSLTSLTLMTTEDGTPGVSLNLNVSFVKPAKLGEKIRIEAEVLKQGRTVAFTAARILNQKGDLLALGNHVKHIGG